MSLVGEYAHHQMKRQAATQLKTTIGLNLRAARTAQHLTQRELAQALDTDAFQVSRWEVGRIRPSDATLIRMAEVLGVEYAWLLTEQEQAA